MSTSATSCSTNLSVIVPVSPVPHLLLNNDHPSITEAYLISSTLIEVMRRIDVVFQPSYLVIGGIHPTGDEAHHLHILRGDLVRYRARHRALMVPLRRPPNELLIQIFEHCVKGYESLDYPPGHDQEHHMQRIRVERPSSIASHQCAFQLTKVCRRWRKIAISMQH